MQWFKFSIFFLLANIINAKTISAIELPQTKSFINSMVKKHGFIKKELNFLFKNTYLTIKKPVKTTKITKKKPITWSKYKGLFLTENRINNGVKFYKKYQKELNSAYKKFGVSPYIIVAILGIETNYGNYTGKYPTLQTLSALAFGNNRRQKFYLRELEEFLLLVRENSMQPFKINGSHAGAMGAAQFISSSYNYYAIDFNNDKKIDLFNIVDSIGSIANYFAKHYWQKDGGYFYKTTKNKSAKTSTNKPIKTAKYFRDKKIKINKNIKDEIKLSFIKIYDEKDNKDNSKYLATFWNFYVITRYNHNNMYALATIELANAIEKKLNNKNEKTN